MIRTPLNLIDQLILPWDQAEPFCIMCELRVSGCLDERRLIDAALRAAAHHPIARAHLAKSRWWDRSHDWAVVERITDVPLEVVECADDRARDFARGRFLSRSVSLDETPPFALLLAHHPAGDSVCLSLNHVAGDGMSAYRLMRSIACAYAGLGDEVSRMDPLTVRDIATYGSSSRALERVHRLRLAQQAAIGRRVGGPTTRMASREGKPVSRETGFRSYCLLALTRAETARLVSQRRHPASINDLLLASVALTVGLWNAAHGARIGRIDIAVPINLRPRAWFTQVVGNMVAGADVTVPRSDQRDLATAQLAISRQTEVIKRHRYLTEVDIAKALGLIPIGLRYPMGRLQLKLPASRFTIGLSNLGVVDAPPSLGEEAGAVTGLWFGPPGQAVGTFFGALTMNDQLFITLHYRTDHLDHEGAHAFLDQWRKLLLPE